MALAALIGVSLSPWRLGFSPMDESIERYWKVRKKILMDPYICVRVS